MKRIFVTFFVISSFFVPVKADSNEDAIAFVERVVNEALAIVNNDSMQDEEKRQKLSECVGRYLDIPRITKTVFAFLGYKDLDKADISKVEEYLRKYLIRFYAGKSKLEAMVNAKLNGNSKCVKTNKDFAVTTKFTKGDSGKTTEIAWITDGKQIYYVEIEGMNQVITLRSEMSEAVGKKPLMDFVNEQLAAG